MPLSSSGRLGTSAVKLLGVAPNTEKRDIFHFIPAMSSELFLMVGPKKLSRIVGDEQTVQLVLFRDMSSSWRYHLPRTEHTSRDIQEIYVPRYDGASQLRLPL